MRMASGHHFCRRLERFGCQHRGTRVGKAYARTFILYHHLPERNDYRHADRPHGTLLSEKPARRGVRDAGQLGGLSDRDAARCTEKGRHAGRELRTGGRPRGAGRRSGDRQPKRNHPPHGRTDQLHHLGARTELPAGRPCGEQLPELRLSAGTHQRAGRALHTDIDRLAPGIQCTGRRIWTGTDSRQHD